MVTPNPHQEIEYLPPLQRGAGGRAGSMQAGGRPFGEHRA